ncbi:MAG: Acylphosphatase [Chlamydiales bacterium]|nr:Acylphosphatase [Chlamydiales bacterium]MCH9619583.1 Acylphosphatase [Chlamydiales bacterium]MCH9623189.1 Acylphosphatase [Chlamydiales bacterium]
MRHELHAIFTGVVQGVFFRVTVKKHAEQLALFGSVKNLEDGSVEVFLNGTEQEIEIFLKQVKANPGAARIDSIEYKVRKPQKNYSSFEIIY